MKSTAYDRQAQLFAALAHPLRLRMLELIAEGDCCVCHLSHALDRKQAYVSQQLARLKEAGLIADTRDGLFVYYHLADERILALLSAARGTMAPPDASVRATARKRSTADCPCPKCGQARERARATPAIEPIAAAAKTRGTA